jgi:hypothetical protein
MVSQKIGGCRRCSAVCPIVTCQRMVGRIPGGGGLEGPWAAFIGAVESGLLATVLTRTHAGPLWPRRGSHACQRRAGQRPLSEPCPRRSPSPQRLRLPRARHSGIQRAHPRADGLQPIRPAHRRPREGRYFYTRAHDGWLAQAGPDELTEDHFDAQPLHRQVVPGAVRRPAPQIPRS